MIEDEFVYTAADFLGFALKSGWTPSVMPIGVIYTFQAPVARALAQQSAMFEENRELTVSNASMLVTKDDGPLVMVACLNPGSASMATQLEHLRFLDDATQFAAVVGTAGALTADYQIGETVLVDSALNTSAVARAYLPEDEVVNGDHEFLAAIERHLATDRVARTWTVDVPYRSKRSDVEAALEAGASLVEMEIAALYAAGKVLGVRTAAAAVVSDVDRVDGWEVDWNDTTTPTVNAVGATITAMRELADNG